MRSKTRDGREQEPSGLRSGVGKLDVPTIGRASSLEQDAAHLTWIHSPASLSPENPRTSYRILLRSLVHSSCPSEPGVVRLSFYRLCRRMPHTHCAHIVYILSISAPRAVGYVRSLDLDVSRLRLAWLVTKVPRRDEHEDSLHI